MGSLNNRNDYQKVSGVQDQILANEQAERKLVASKLRCEQEISAWLEHLTIQLTEGGKELMREVEMTSNQLLMDVRRRDEDARDNWSKEMENDLDMKFIPKELEKFGFLVHGKLLPSSCSLKLLTKIPDVSVGATVVCCIEVEGDISPFVKKKLVFSVHRERNESVAVQEACSPSKESCFQFSFVIPSFGDFTVTARLYNSQPKSKHVNMAVKEQEVMVVQRPVMAKWTP
eukprot:GFUD01025736.1.p1 GENE.GFUD01025736.1~~GFUD01025736.1.p1  ORF type:complete len:230 (+),score=60.11 GFUD01025736.1:69-758(+)